MSSNITNRGMNFYGRLQYLLWLKPRLGCDDLHACENTIKTNGQVGNGEESAGPFEAKPGVSSAVSTPLKVSVVIPVRNEEHSLGVLIQSLLEQTRPPAEIIIVDGGSTDQTLSLARRLTAADRRFTVISAGPANPGKGRNIGMGAAKFEWIAFTDAGIYLEPTWLERLTDVVERDPSVEVVYGNYEPIADSVFKRFASLAYASARKNIEGHYVRGRFIASSLMLRRVWHAVHGFPSLRAAEDLIFMERIEAAGFSVAWAPTATVWWEIQPSLWQTFKRFAINSRHNVFAERQYDWHYGVAKQYLVAGAFLLPSLMHSIWWLMFPMLGAAARVAKSIWTRREGRGLAWAINPIQFIGVGITMFVVDLAMYAGWIQARLELLHRNNSVLHRAESIFLCLRERFLLRKRTRHPEDETNRVD